MRLLSVSVSVVLLGCCGLDARYVQADRLTYRAVAPEYEAYLAGDRGLSAEQQQRRRRTLAAWKDRLEEARRLEESK